MTEAIECPTCGADARENSRLHCTSRCPWIICTNKDCRTVYVWDNPTMHFV